MDRDRLFVIRKHDTHIKYAVVHVVVNGTMILSYKCINTLATDAVIFFSGNRAAVGVKRYNAGK